MIALPLSRACVLEADRVGAEFVARVSHEAYVSDILLLYNFDGLSSTNIYYSLLGLSSANTY